VLSRPGPLETSILFDVFALNQAVARLLATAMRDSPLTPGEYAVYSAVFELEAASPTELARRLGMRLTTFMDQLRLVEGRGHALRVRHPTDRRSYRVVLTAEGLAAHRSANRRFEAAYQAVIARLAGREAAAKQGLHAARTAVERAIAGFEAPDARVSSAESETAAASPRGRGGPGG
jgi:DNA-binding MarR family transcriptional regulator